MNKMENRYTYKPQGKTALASREKNYSHGIANHAEGFVYPIGKLKGINLAIEDMSPKDLSAYNITEQQCKARV
jgi:phenylalanine-4-hydroxylase